jgi:hypothetical protein
VSGLWGMGNVGAFVAFGESGDHDHFEENSMSTQPKEFEVKKPNGSEGGMLAVELVPVPLSGKAAALKLMRKPFEPHQISTMCRPTKKDNPAGNCRACGGFHKLPAVQLSYVGHAALTDRLLDADPEWTWEPLSYAPDGTPLLDAQGGMWIKLSVAGVTRLGYGDAQGKIGGDATKERIGDALRNAAMRFGAALELWHKGTLHLVEASTDTDSTQPEGIDDTVERVEFINNCRDFEELKTVFKTHYTAAKQAKDNRAEKLIVAAYEQKKRELNANH